MFASRGLGPTRAVDLTISGNNAPLLALKRCRYAMS